MNRKNYKHREVSPVISVILGVLVAAAVCTGLCALSAYMTLSGYMREQHMSIVIAVAQLVGMLAGGWSALHLTGIKSVWVPLSVVISEILLLLAMHILVLEEPVVMVWPNVLSSLIATAAFLLHQLSRGRKGRLKYKKH